MAQLDRAPAYEAGGWRFESSWAYQHFFLARVRQTPESSGFPSLPRPVAGWRDVGQTPELPHSAHAHVPNQGPPECKPMAQSPPSLPSKHSDERWMEHALGLARRAAEEGEIPVGAALIRGDRLLGEGWNRTLTLADPTAHAEILALRRAAASVRNYRLSGTTLVCTLEPCVMCFGAILESRVSRVVIGASDSDRGALKLWKSGAWASYPVGDLAVTEGVAASRCRDLLKSYFLGKRRSR